MSEHHPERFRELLAADLAVEKGEDPAAVGAALSGFWETGDPGKMADIRSRVADELQAALAKAGGDAEQAVSSRGGLDHSLILSVPALSDFDPGVRANLREIDPERYVEFEKLAAGGMGVVYLALDTELNRKVALKLVGSDSGSGPLGENTEPIPADWIARFLQEARVTGGLEHPGIVPVYELGKTPSGKPYYTMRVVRGQRTLADAIREALDLTSRLALLEPFLKACDTMRYAHSRGVIHRDLKPANIALGDFGEVVVLDWGLARVGGGADHAESRWHERMGELRSESGLATFIAALGTPAYMSPEALGSDLSAVGVQSDVYSLGVILYKALTGKRPHGESGLLSRMEDLSAATPPAPVELDPAIPAELSRICLKALAIDRTERYADAGALADDIRRWQRESSVEREIASMLSAARDGLSTARELDGSALLSQVDRVLVLTARVLELSPGHAEAERIEAEARMRRAAALEARERAGRTRLLRRVGVVVLALATAAAILVAVLLDERRREAEEARANAVVARKRAEEERARAEDLSDFMLVDLRDKLEPLGRLDLLGAVARKSLAYQQGLPERALSDEDLRGRGIALGNLGDVLSAGGDLDGALESYREELRIARRLAEASPDIVSRQRDLALVLERVGDAELAGGNLDGAEEALAESLSIKLRLVEVDPGNPELFRDLANGHDRIGRVAMLRGDVDSALSSYLAGLAIREARVAASSGDPDWQSQLSVSLALVAEVHQARGEFETALDFAERSLQLRRDLVAADPEHYARQRELVVALMRGGDIHLALGDAEAALTSYGEALEQALRLSKRDSTNANWQRDVSVARDRIGDVHAARGELDEALASYQQSLAIRERLAEADPGNLRRQRDVEVCHDMIGRIHKARGDADAAILSLTRALAIAERLTAADPENMLLARDVYVTLASLAGAYELAEDWKKCAEVLGLSVKCCEAVVSRAEHLAGELEQLRAAHAEAVEQAAKAGD